LDVDTSLWRRGGENGEEPPKKLPVPPKKKVLTILFWSAISRKEKGVVVE